MLKSMEDDGETLKLNISKLMTSDDEMSPGNERTHCRNMLFIPQICVGKTHVPAVVCILMQNISLSFLHQKSNHHSLAPKPDSVT